MAFSLVWSLGYLISIIVFSTVIGLIFYFNEISNKALAKYLVVSVICTSAVIYVISIFKNQLYSAIGVYNYTFLFLIAFVLIFIGYILSREDNFKNCFKKVLSLSYLSFILVAFVCVLSREDLFGLNSLQVTVFTTILFNLLIVTVFFILKRLNLVDRSFKILRELSDKEHYVYTGYALKQGDKLVQGIAKSSVFFNELSDELINAYIETGSPMDKAGAYGLQDNEKFQLVKKTSGSNNNIIGFPTEQILLDLKNFIL